MFEDYFSTFLIDALLKQNFCIFDVPFIQYEAIMGELLLNARY